MILIFFIVFTGIMGREIDNYWAYLCIGMFPFTFFQTNLGQGSGCVASNAGTIKKMYFPREIVALSQVISTFITFLIAYVVVIVLMLMAGIGIVANAIIFLPFIVALSIIFATGYVLFLSAVSVFVRDVKNFIDATARVLFWITPIFYMAGNVSGVLETVIWLNPLTYFIDAYHSVLYFGVAPDMFGLGVCLLLSVVALIAGLITFNRLKGKFAEVL
jgi:ABC-2 type transport system permease protein